MSNLSMESNFRGQRRKPWGGQTGVRAVLDAWRQNPKLYPQVVLDAHIDAQEGAYADLPADLAPGIRAALASRGIEQLFSHQARALELGRGGQHYVIATPTASGKSLCYNLPVLEAMAQRHDTRALYLFPTKALSRDQEEVLRSLMTDAGLTQGALTYDGDTPADARRAGRERSGILLTNPDMLHAGILPHHTNWARFFANLSYVVIDELHTYRGVFGSHLANLVRRLKRIAAFHGANPTFVFASATIGNPAEHAARMVGERVELIAESGAPSGPKSVCVYNPPVVNAELGIRGSYIKASVRLAADLVRAGVSTIVFGQSRNNVEVMLKYLRERLAHDKIPGDVIHGYRGGYLPGKRREIEAGLRSGEIRCVVATSALELGIDIGALDAVVCAGYPGSVASLWQRFGRAGRRRAESLAVLITSSSPLNQFFAHQPDSLIGAPVEHARIDPDNIEILIQHLKCAAFELPFASDETFGDVTREDVREGLEFLTSHDVLHKVDSGDGKAVYHWATDSYPANHVSLRSVGWDNFVIIDMDGDRTIAEMDWRSTHTMLHEQAIYQHAAEQYQVEKLDYENHKAYVRKVRPDYYTDAMTHVRIAVIEQEEGRPLELAPVDAVTASLGEISVVEKVVGYKKIKYHTHENVGYGDVRLPELEMHTTAFWLEVSSDLVEAMPVGRPIVIDTLRGISKAMHIVATVGLMTDPRDLGRTVKDKAEPEDEPSADQGARFDPTIFLYDKAPGGVGLAPRLFDEREGLLRATRRLIENCACDDGCPACIGPQVGLEDQMPGESETTQIAPPVDVSRRVLALELLGRMGVGEA